MGKTWKRILSKRYLLFTFVALMMVESLISNSYGQEEKKVRYGFSIFGGAGEALHGTPDMTVYGFLPRVDLLLHRNWDLELEGNYSFWNIRKKHDLHFLGVDVNILFKPIQRRWGSLFLLGGAGLGYDSAGKRVEQIGDSHCGGILQGGAGIYYNLGKGMLLRAEYRFYHISEPFRNDTGLNTHTALLGISF
jgi:opacity protein-like surface antigen